MRQSWPARLTIVPYNTGWHLAHHVDSGIPFRNLPKYHAELVALGLRPASARVPDTTARSGASSPPADAWVDSQSSVAPACGRARSAPSADTITVEGVTLLDAGDFVILQRHGFDHYVRAHEIDHRANVLALRAAGCDRVLGLSSTGSLRVDWPVGTIVCPDDFYAPDRSTITIHDDARSHTVPVVRPAVARAGCSRRGRSNAATPILDGGVYTQTRGPRFETPAEVRALARIGDLVGMTIAAECILSKEIGLAYAAVCVVDNLANGLDDGAADPRAVPGRGRGKPGRAARRSRYGAARARGIRLMALTVTNATLDGEPVGAARGRRDHRRARPGRPRRARRRDARRGAAPR